MIERKMVFRSAIALIIVRKKVSCILGWQMEAIVAAAKPTEAKEKILTVATSFAYKERMISYQIFNPQAVGWQFVVPFYSQGTPECHQRS